LATLIAGVMQVQAQEFKTNESISSQLKKGNTPGLKYGTVPVRPIQSVDKSEGQESSISQIRKGTLKGMQFAPGTGAARNSSMGARSTARPQPANGILPSDQKAGSLKPAAAKIPVVVPTQDGVTVPREVKQAPVGTSPAPGSGGVPAADKKKQPAPKNLN
jgi:hypothetical protein